MKCGYGGAEEDVLYIGNHLISVQNSLDSCSMKEGVKTIADYAFSHSKVKNIIIPDSAVGVGNYSFYSCQNLMSVSIGNGVEYIGNFI